MLASAKQKEDAYNKKMPYGKKHPHSDFKESTKLYLKDKSINELYDQDVLTVLKELQCRFSGFNKFPDEAKWGVVGYGI